MVLLYTTRFRLLCARWSCFRTVWIDFQTVGGGEVRIKNDRKTAKKKKNVFMRLLYNSVYTAVSECHDNEPVQGNKI